MFAYVSHELICLHMCHTSQYVACVFVLRDSAVTKVSKAARTRKSVSNRLVHLALPKTIGLRYQFFPKSTSVSDAALNAKTSEHTRQLATPKGRQFTPSTECFDPVPFNKPIWKVSQNALWADCSDWIEELARPRPLDTKHLIQPLPKPINKATLKAKISERTRALAKPRWVIDKEIIDPFAVLPRALVAVTTDHTSELAQPKRIKGVPQRY